jgi:molybdate transport system substrate-binding protein
VADSPIAPGSEVGYNPAVFVEMNRPPHPGRLLIAIVAALLAFATASGQDVPSLKVMISPGFKAAYEELVPEFERKTGHTIVTVYGASMGNAPDAIPNRLQRGEPADVIILASSALADLSKKDKIISSTQVNLARSGIAIAVRAGAQKPDISTLEALKRTLLAAKSIAYSDSVSGVYVSTELFQRLGIADDIRSKCMKVNGMVGPAVARGDAEIGFQQLSELLPIPGIDIVGPIPAEAQKITMFSGAVAGNSKQPELAKQFLQYLASPAAAPAIKKSGMQPALDPLTSK